MDHGIRYCNSHGKGVDFLPKRLHGGLAVQLLQTFFHTGQHLAGAHSHIINCAVDSIVILYDIVVGQQQVAHQVNDISAGKMGSGLFVVGLREPLHQIFKDIPHIHCGNTVWAHIQIFCRKVHNDLIKYARLNHAIYLRLEVHTGKKLLYIIGKAC